MDFRKKEFIRYYLAGPVALFLLLFVLYRFRDKLSLARSLVGALAQVVLFTIIAAVAGLAVSWLTRRAVTSANSLQATAPGALFAWRDNYKASPLKNSAGLFLVYADRLTHQPKNSRKEAITINKQVIKKWSISPYNGNTHGASVVSLKIVSSDDTQYKFYLSYVTFEKYAELQAIMEKQCPNEGALSSSTVE